MMEDKDRICREFARVLQKTRIGENVLDILYVQDEHEETARVLYRDLITGRLERLEVNITADSGLSILKDIIYALEDK